MPNAPDESCFLLGAFSSPSVFPIHTNVSGQRATPLGPAQVNLRIISADPRTSQLRGVLKQGDFLRPAVSVRIELQVLNRAIEEVGGELMSTFNDLSDTNLHHHASEAVTKIEVELQGGELAVVGSEPDMDIRNPRERA